MVAALHELGLLDGDDRGDATRLAGVVDKARVVALVERSGRRNDPARGELGK
jgi:hypothetical protein